MLKRWSHQYASNLLADSTTSLPTHAKREKIASYFLAFQSNRIVRVLKAIPANWTHSRQQLVFEHFSRHNAVDPQDVAISCQFGIGDAYIACGLAHALKTSLDARRITVFTREKLGFLPRLFPSVDACITVPEIVGIQNVGGDELALGKIFYAHFRCHRQMDQMGRDSIDMRGWYTRLFQVGNDVAFEEPRKPTHSEIDMACDLLGKSGCILQRTVIICRDTVSTATVDVIPSAFWEGLALQLSKAGINVASNVGPSGVPIDGTIPLQIPLNLFRATALVSGGIVANRSGICDLVADLPLYLGVIFPEITWHGGPLAELASLNRMGTRQNAEEIVVSADTAQFEEVYSRVISGFQCWRGVRGSRAFIRDNSGGAVLGQAGLVG